MVFTWYIFVLTMRKVYFAIILITLPNENDTLSEIENDITAF